MSEAGELRGVDIKILISSQVPHLLLGINTRVRLNILSFVSYDVLGFVPTPLVHSDSPHTATLEANVVSQNFLVAFLSLHINPMR